MFEIAELIVMIAIGLCVVIPLIIAIVKATAKLVKEKGWKTLLPIIYNLIVEAESQFSTGEERKKFVVDKAMEAAKAIDYSIDRMDIERLIDSAVDLSKLINKKTKK